MFLSCVQHPATLSTPCSIWPCQALFLPCTYSSVYWECSVATASLLGCLSACPSRPSSSSNVTFSEPIFDCLQVKTEVSPSRVPTVPSPSTSSSPSLLKLRPHYPPHRSGSLPLDVRTGAHFIQALKHSSLTFQSV